ncbi:MAG TPA: peptidyl-prolyl cis-trans isomerase [Desulfuromonadales bacterium]|nr:peptidyl-prolyl cis-trans isomerase [Desulfuromonadales bacterium]
MNSRHLVARTALLAFFLLSLAACKEKPKASSQILLRVDGRTVTLEQFQKDFAASLPAGQNLTRDERKELERSYLVQVVDRQLTLAEADRLHVAVTPAEVDVALKGYRKDYADDDAAFASMLKERGIPLAQWRKELEDSLLMEKVAKQAVYAKVTVSDAEIAKYYQHHQKDFNRAAQVRARQIVVSTKKEGERLLGLLRQGEPFAKVAKTYSLSPDAAQGGDLGFFARGEMPAEFDAVVFSLPVGQLSDLVKSQYGYHLFLVEARRPAEHLTLKDVAGTIRKKLLAEREEQAYQRWLQNLRAQAKIEINWTLL